MRAAPRAASVSLSERGTIGDEHDRDGHERSQAGRAEFPRAARLVRARDFLRLRNEGQRVGTRHLSAQIATNDSGRARLGLAISKRVSKHAVRRNRIKRIARNSFRARQHSLPAFDILIIARGSADAESNASLRDELSRLWQRIVALNAAVTTGTMRD